MSFSDAVGFLLLTLAIVVVLVFAVLLIVDWGTRR